MKKIIGTMAFIAALVLAGCGKVTTAADPQQTTTPATKAIATEPTTSEDQMKIIGDKATGDSVYIITLDNKTGKDIKSFTIKADTEKEYPASMIEPKDIFAKNERRRLYYVPVKTSDVTYGDTDEIATQEYTVKITFSDDKEAELHQFPFGDIELGEILMDKDVAYIEYISKLSDKKVSTKEAEKMIAETAKPEEPTEAASEIEQSYYEEPVYTQPAYQEPVYTEPATQYIEPTTVYIAPTEAPTQATADDGNGGCLSGGGLFNE